MPNDETHSIDDLFQDGTDAGDDASTSDASTSDSKESKDETDKTDLDLSPAEEAKQTFAAAWAKKIQSGTATMEDLKLKQAWLVPLVQEKLKVAPIFDPEEFKRIAREEAKNLFESEQAKVSERQSVERFSALKEQLQSLYLTPAQKAVIKERYAEYSGKLEPYDALRTAADIAHVDFERVDARRMAAATPRSGLGVQRQTVSDDIEDIDIDAVNNSWNRDQRAAYLKKYPGRSG